MKFREIRIGELDELVATRWYRNQVVIPITPSRAISQAINPYAHPNDVGLILATGNEDALVGFVGILPARLYVSPTERFYYNTCWWVNPETGKRASMPLFYRMLEITGERLVLADMTPYTQQIVEATGRFRVQEPSEGIYMWFKGGLGISLCRKAGYKRWVKHLAAPFDHVVNGFRYFSISRWKNSTKDEALNVLPASLNDPDIIQFIDHCCAENLITRRTSDLAWVLRMPWLITGRGKRVPVPYYPFSWRVLSFEQNIVKFQRENELLGVSVVTFRDGIAKVPYLYCLPGKEEEIAESLLFWLLHQPIHGLITWNNYLLEAIQKTAFPVLRKKVVFKRTAYSNVLAKFLRNRFTLQDGDGDAVFT